MPARTVALVLYMSLLISNSGWAQFGVGPAGTIPTWDGELYYRTAGTGAAVILLAGGPGHSGDYLTLLFEHVAQTSHFAILPDLRGTGKSKLRALNSTTVTTDKAVADLELIRQQLGVDQWTIVGPRAPSLFLIAGEADAIAETSDAELKEIVPKATLTVIPRAGHFPWVEAPESFFRAFDAALKTSP